MTERTVFVMKKGSILGTGEFSIREKGDLIVKVSIFIRKISFHLKSKEKEKQTNKQNKQMVKALPSITMCFILKQLSCTSAT